MDGAGEQKEIRLSIGGVIMDDLLRRNRGPLIIKPSVPSVFWVPFAAGLNFELRSDGVCHTTTGAGLCVTVRMLTVIRPLKAFKPSFVRPIGPITTRDSGLSAGNSQRRRDQDGRARPCGSSHRLISLWCARRWKGYGCYDWLLHYAIGYLSQLM